MVHITNPRTLNYRTLDIPWPFVTHEHGTGDTRSPAIGLFSDWTRIFPRFGMPAAADLRLPARPDLIELDKLFDISESSLIHHSALLGRETRRPVIAVAD